MAFDMESDARLGCVDRSLQCGVVHLCIDSGQLGAHEGSGGDGGICTLGCLHGVDLCALGVLQAIVP